MDRFLRRSFWNGACERAVSTAAQTFVAVVGSASAFGAVDWWMVCSATGMAALLSLVKAFAAPNQADTAVVTYAPRHVLPNE